MAHKTRTDYFTYAFWCFTMSVALLPIGLGGDRPFPLGCAQAGMAFSCLFLVMSEEGRKSLHFDARLRYALILLVAVLVWALIQTQPFVPENWAHPLWQSTASVLNLSVRGSISIAPEDSLHGLTRLITYAAGGFLAYLLTQDPLRARQLVRTIWITGTVICIYGLVIYIFDLEQILWFKKWTYIGDLTATFVNHNHFAMYGGIVFVSGTALLIQSWREDVQRRKPHQRIDALRVWLVHQAVPKVFLLLLVLTCVILSHSRAGFIFSLIAFGGYLFLYQIYLRAWRRAIIIGIVILAFLAAAFTAAVFFSDHFAELFNDQSSLDRSYVYDLALRALQDNPWLGYGLNGFEPEFRLYQQGMAQEFNHAHSDILESLVDLGIPAGLLLWTSIALMLNTLWRGITRRRQNGIFPTLAFAVSLGVLGHAMFDFDLQIPGVALTWTALLGTGLAQSWNRSEKKESPPGR